MSTKLLAVAEELADVLMYCIDMADALGVDIPTIISDNDRERCGKLGGDGLDIELVAEGAHDLLHRGEGRVSRG